LGIGMSAASAGTPASIIVSIKPPRMEILMVHSRFEVRAV
jgi:hypothetical protein